GAGAMSGQAHEDSAASARSPLDHERGKTADDDGTGARDHAADGYQLEGQAAQKPALREVDVGSPETEDIVNRDERRADDCEDREEARRPTAGGKAHAAADQQEGEQTH